MIGIVEFFLLGVQLRIQIGDLIRQGCEDDPVVQQQPQHRDGRQADVSFSFGNNHVDLTYAGVCETNGKRHFIAAVVGLPHVDQFHVAEFPHLLKAVEQAEDCFLVGGFS